MRTFLLAGGTVHAIAAGCDYLAERVGPDDRVIALSIRETATEVTERDAADALNVADVRLSGSVETVRGKDGLETSIREIALEYDVDEIVLGVTEQATIDGTAVLSMDLDRPFVIVPAL